MARPSLRNVAFDHGPTVTRMFAAFNGRNLDDWMADATEDVEVESRFSSVGHTTFRGRDGVVSWWGDLAEASDPIEAELESSRDVSTDESVILITLHGKGRNCRSASAISTATRRTRRTAFSLNRGDWI